MRREARRGPSQKGTAMSDTSTITIETTARGLHELLDPVPTLRRQRRLSARPATVRLCGKGKWVTATTTDRYRLAMQRREIAAPDGWSALVNVRGIKAIFATFKATRANDPRWSCPLMAAPCASKVAPCSRVGSSARPSRSTSTPASTPQFQGHC